MKDEVAFICQSLSMSATEFDYVRLAVFHPSSFRLHPLDNAEPLADCFESCDGLLQILSRVRGGNLRAQAGFAFRHDGVPKPFDVDTLVQQRATHLLRQRRFAEHDWDNRMMTFKDS